ncbi:ABC transporter permease [Subtercola frigoramans]|uniref:Peptide/nickel transport system permease protein n=1 Tax=Subtercola frigoramans TaxID=120298 RepID=A0ABS2L2Q3_9MICO|nr:ABC transporter permease [Subtercola frigoramans]MBM7470761.1 peptide/nickel transport system permease protein [Subtercola frigoramans]
MTFIILRRLLLSIPLLFVASIITFVLQAFVPGDPARTLLGLNATPEQYQALRESLHLNEPILTQYWLYLSDALRGQFGTSIFTGEPVVDTIGQRLPVTLSLIVAATLVATIIGVLFGVFSATRGPVVRRLVDVSSLVGNALPNFWVALVLVAIFAIGMGAFPATGYSDLADSPSDWALSLVLPVIALSLGGIALVAKVTRDGMLTTLQLDHIRTLRASGVGRRSLIWKHSLRNSGIAVVTVIGLTLISFVSGSILIENVFALPGLGTLIVTATNKHDVPVVQGLAITFTLIVIVTNLIVDVVYGLLNPKVRIR